MKTIARITLAGVMALAGGVCLARGAAPSSFVPRGPEPHSTLADKHGTKSFARKPAHHKASPAQKRGASRPPKSG